MSKEFYEAQEVSDDGRECISCWRLTRRITQMNVEKAYLQCDYYYKGACTCSAIDKWYACELEEVNPEDIVTFEEEEK